MNLFRSAKGRFGILLVLFFLSGFTALIYQTLWVRVCGQIMGVTVFAVSCVLTAFMTGLALGSIIFGRFIDRGSNGLRLYAGLEALIGAYALLFPLLIQGVNALHIWFYRSFHPDFYTLTGFRFLLSFAVMILPALCMGGTLPALSKYAVSGLPRVGKDVGSLYSVNSLGAVAGSCITAFFLIYALGIQLSLVAAALLNFAIAGAALWLSGLRVIDKKESSAVSPASISQTALRIVLAVFFIEGLAALGLEVVWQRLFVFYFGNSIYAFTVVASTFILGISIGSFLCSRFVNRLRNPLLVFGAVELIIGLSSFTASWMLYSFTPSLLSLFLGFNAMGWWGSIIFRAAVAVCIMIVPTVAMGMAFPLACTLAARNMHLLGSEIGTAYAANTIGSIIGAFAGGFLLVPCIGLHGSSSLLAALLLASGVLVVVTHPAVKGSVKGVVSAVSACAVFMFAFLPFSQKFVSFRPSLFDTVIYYREGTGGTVMVKDSREGIRELSVNGTSLATTLYNHRQLFRMLAHLPALMHPDAHNAVVVGLGGGMTAGTLLLHDSLRSVDCIELTPEIKQGTEFFAKENYEVLENPRFHLTIEDGKNYMLIADKKYDCITSDPIHPIIAGNSSLYSVNYFRLCRKRLADSGVICHWLPFHSISREHYSMIIRSFIDVFPHASLWYAGEYTMLLGTPEKLRIDFADLKKRLADPEVKESLEEYGLDNALEFINCFMMGEDALADCVKGVPQNDDSRAIVEFLGPRRASLRSPGGLALFKDRRESALQYCTRVTAQDSSAFPACFQAKTCSLMGQFAGWEKQPAEIQFEAYHKSLEISPDNKNTKRLIAIMNGESF